MRSQAHWTNIHAHTGEYGFWKHEWEKHGRCAAALPAMSSELKYFSEGVALNAKYPIKQYLDKAGIVPDNAQR